MDGDKITRNAGYYIVAQVSKFVRPGSVRIGSSAPRNFNNVSFVTPKGEKIVIAINNGTTKKLFSIQYGKKSFTATLLPGAVGTYIWK